MPNSNANTKTKNKLQKEYFKKFKPEKEISRRIISNLEKRFIKMKILGPNKGIITGSYRRGKPYSGDIDFVFVVDVISYKDIVDILKTHGYKLHTYSKGLKQAFSILEFPSGKTLKVDMWFAPKEEFAYTILHTTGDKLFNITMRAIAKNKNMLLNQHGLFMLCDNKMLQAKTEKDIFHHLGREYMPPEERNWIDKRTKLVKKT